MTGPINRPASTTPDPSVHRAPDSSLNKFAFEIQYLEAVGQKMLQAFLQIVVQAILGLVTGKDLPALQAQLANWATVLEGVANTALQNFEILLVDTEQATIAELAALINKIQQILDALVNFFTGGNSTNNPVAALIDSASAGLQGLLSTASDNFDGTAKAITTAIINGDGTVFASFNAFLRDGSLSALIDNLDGTVLGLQKLIVNGDGTAFFGAASALNPVGALIDAADGTAMSIASGLQNLVNPVGTANYAVSNWQTLLGNTGLSSANQLSASLGGLIPAALDQFDGTALGIGTQIVQNLDGTATFLTQSATNAIAALISQADGTAMSVATALQAAVPNANTAVQNLNSVIAGIGGTAITDVNNYLQNVPNTAVLGLTGFGTNIGNTISALSDGVWQGLRAFLGVPSGVGPPQVSSAAQQVRVDLNNATTIASTATQLLSLQAITKQSFLSIDPSADSVFPLSIVSGASPTTVPVVQTKSVMGAILLPNLTKKESIAFMHGPLTNITAVYINLYKVNKTTGAFTNFHASANVISSLSTPVSGYAWSFYNLPLANYFDVTQDGTGGTTSTVMAIGDYVIVEIQTAGSGTLNMIGLTNALPVHPTIYPKALGAARTDLAATRTAVSGDIAGVNGGSSTIDISAETNCVVVAVSNMAGGGGSTAVTIGGVSATFSGSQSFSTSSSVVFFTLMNPPVGTGKSVVISISGASPSYLCAGKALAYKGVVSVGTAAGATGSGTSISQSISSTNNQTVIQIAASLQTSVSGTTMASYTKTALMNKAYTASVNYGTLIGEFAGSTASQTGSMTAPASGSWGSCMLPLNGAVAPAPSSISSPAYDSNVPWIALAGAVGRSEHSPETVAFETAGSGQTYTVPSWVIDGDYIDIVPVGGGAGGSHVGTRNTTADPAYKGGGAGSWNPIRLRYGSAYDIPTGTTTFTVTVGAAGAGAGNPGLNQPPVHGSAGGNTTVVITGYPTITATGGAADGSTITFQRAWSGGPFVRGDTPGNVVHQGVTYFGGATSDGTGNPPGGGGGAGSADSVGGSVSALGGAHGAAYITATQN